MNRSSDISGSVRIALVDGDRAFCAGFSSKLRRSRAVYSVDEFNHAEDFWRASARRMYDLLFLDLQLPGTDGLSLLSMLEKRRNKPRPIVLTGVEDELEILKAFRRGAVGYILKRELHQLRDLIGMAVSDGAVVTSRIAQVLINHVVSDRQVARPLSTREHQVLELLVSDLSTDDVARIMGISPHTMRKHIRNIYCKLEVNSRMGLAIKAKEIGLL